MLNTQIKEATKVPHQEVEKKGVMGSKCMALFQKKEKSRTFD